MICWEVQFTAAPVGVLKLAAKALSGNVSLNRRMNLRGQVCWEQK